MPATKGIRASAKRFRRCRRQFALSRQESSIRDRLLLETHLLSMTGPNGLEDFGEEEHQAAILGGVLKASRGSAQRCRA